MTLSVAPPLAPCGFVSLTVKPIQGLTWVIVGIKAPATTIIQWKADPKVSASGWTFSDVAVPCQPGPYALRFMKDAEQNDPSKGTVVASCTP